MTTFVLEIASIAGESETVTNASDCMALRHTIDLPVLATSGDRTEGASKHGSIELQKRLDKASPKLRHAASAGTDLGTVTIKRIRAGGGAVVETITLESTFVVRYDMYTPIDTDEREPGDDYVEIIGLEYKTITWTLIPFVNNVAQPVVTANYNVSTRTSV